MNIDVVPDEISSCIFLSDFGFTEDIHIKEEDLDEIVTSTPPNSPPCSPIDSIENDCFQQMSTYPCYSDPLIYPNCSSLEKSNASCPTFPVYSLPSVPMYSSYPSMNDFSVNNVTYSPYYIMSPISYTDYLSAYPTSINFVPTGYMPKSCYTPNMLSSYPPLSNPDVVTGKKRKSSPQTYKRRVRPKVVPEKGQIQCKGRNRKKNQRCRNAALMEYIGPRPKYCAEHIHMDKECFYTKCKSLYQKVMGDNKGCREVVLKEFGLCHKHYGDEVEKMVGEEGLVLAMEKLRRVTELLTNLEMEAMRAKKSDTDLYQRKNKLIPKFQEMERLLALRVKKLRHEVCNNARVVSG
jgi:hypothetical protein